MSYHIYKKEYLYQIHINILYILVKVGIKLCSLFMIAMPTIQQLIRNKRQATEKKTKSPALRACPQRRGVCTRVYV
jgi:hypothetical protein